MTERVSRSFLRKLKRLGVDFIFANPGSEFIPLIEEYHHADPNLFPKPVLVPHESLAVNMAHGAFLATGRPQAVMVHSIVGTANALLGLIGARRMNIPVLFLSGRTPVTSMGVGSRDRFIHWGQESFDQGSMAREFVKWDYELRRPEMLDEVLTRAWEVMSSAPAGPVSLMIPRELFYESVDVAELSLPRPASNVVPAPAELGEAASYFGQSERGVVVTTRSGLDPRTVARLQEFCTHFQFGVVCPQAQAMNFPVTHECFLGYESDLVAEADVVLVLDTDVPWFPARVRPGAKIIHLAPDPLFQDLPARHFPATMNLRGDIAETLALFVEFPVRQISPWVRRKGWLGKTKGMLGRTTD